MQTPMFMLNITLFKKTNKKKPDKSDPEVHHKQTEIPKTPNATKQQKPNKLKTQDFELSDPN